MRRKPFPLMQKAIPVVKKDEFIFAAVSLEHAHIYNMCHGLIDAGATLKWVYDSDLQKVAAFMKEFPQAKMANDLDEIWLIHRFNWSPLLEFLASVVL